MAKTETSGCEPEEHKVGPAKPCALAQNPDLNLQPGEKVTHEAQGPLQPWAQLSWVLGKPDPALLLLTNHSSHCLCNSTQSWNPVGKPDLHPMALQNSHFTIQKHKQS